MQKKGDARQAAFGDAVAGALARCFFPSDWVLYYLMLEREPLRSWGCPNLALKREPFGATWSSARTWMCTGGQNLKMLFAASSNRPVENITYIAHWSAKTNAWLSFPPRSWPRQRALEQIVDFWQTRPHVRVFVSLCLCVFVSLCVCVFGKGHTMRWPPDCHWCLGPAGGMASLWSPYQNHQKKRG